MTLDDCKGHWALVTGASSGIGREFATQLAAKGMNVVLVARRANRLEELAERLTQDHHVRAIPQAHDLSMPGCGVKLRESLRAREVRIRLLCNCAAFGRWGHVEAQPIETYNEMVRVNVNAVAELCLAFFEDLSAYPSSAIINLSSVASLQPVPFMALYAATKAFVQSLSQSLYEEWREHGVYVQTLTPGPTASEFDAIAGAYQSTVTARQPPGKVVDASLRSLEKGAPVVYAARGALTQRLLAALVPPQLFLKEAAKLFRPPRTGPGK
jgi:short-subunit dehydrogenase